MKSVLFVCYGSGHVRMVVPVATALRDAGLARVQVLGFTTAAPVVREAGLDLLQVKDFTRAQDAEALARGRALVAGLGSVADPHESAAYLGMCFGELADTVGEDEALRRYQCEGRQSFLPTRLLSRIVSSVAPDLLVATNSPRGERAAILAARSLGIPAVCMVDLFAVDEVRWIGQPGYADRVCVLNDSVRQFLISAGRRPDEIRVTGNPAFDVLGAPALRADGDALRQAQRWQGKHVVLWPSQVEPAHHPFNGRPGDPALPQELLVTLVAWVLRQDDVVLCVRPRAGEEAPALPSDPRILVTGQDWRLPPLLAAVDAVVTLSSTVGLEGALAGARLIQVLGSVFDPAMPLARYGLADAAVALCDLEPALERWVRAPRRQPGEQMPAATPRVLDVLGEFL